MSRDIRAIAVYILNDFKRAYSKTYSDLSASTRKNFRVTDLIIKSMKLIKNSQANAFFDDDFVESFSVTASRVDIIEVNISILSTRTVVFKFSILKIAFVIPRKTSQAERIDQLNKSSVVSSAVNSISSQIQFFNLNKKIFAPSISQDTRFIKHEFSFVISENVLNKILQKNIAERILKRILLSNTMKLPEIV